METTSGLRPLARDDERLPETLAASPWPYREAGGAPKHVQVRCGGRICGFVDCLESAVRHSESLVLQRVYRFYRFLPGIDDIYQDLSETQDWTGDPKRKRHPDPTPESPWYYSVFTVCEAVAIFQRRIQTLMF
jgi:hypothetical protein